MALSHKNLCAPAKDPSGSPQGVDGSILMETILVLPILLMLLGAVFLLGDLALARLVTQDAGRHEAWTTDARVQFAETMDAFKFAETENYFDIEKAYSTGRDFSDERLSTGNAWGWGRMGYAVSKSELPLWSALVNTQDDVMHTGGERMESEFGIHGEDSIFAPSFDYHRISPATAEMVGYDMDVYDRTRGAAAVEETAIAGDAHFGIAGAPQGDAHGARTVYNRNPLLMGLAK